MARTRERGAKVLHDEVRLVLRPPRTAFEVVLDSLGLVLRRQAPDVHPGALHRVDPLNEIICPRRVVRAARNVVACAGSKGYGVSAQVAIDGSVRFRVR